MRWIGSGADRSGGRNADGSSRYADDASSRHFRTCDACCGRNPGGCSGDALFADDVVAVDGYTYESGGNGSGRSISGRSGSGRSGSGRNQTG